VSRAKTGAGSASAVFRDTNVAAELKGVPRRRAARHLAVFRDTNVAAELKVEYRNSADAVMSSYSATPMSLH